MDEKQRNLFLDYGELIAKYHFSPDTFDRTHRTSQNHINSFSSLNFSLDQVRDSHTKAIKEYLEARKDGTEWSMFRIMELMLKNLKAEQVSPADIGNIYALADHDWFILPEARQAIPLLAQKYTLGIISNMPHDAPIHELRDSELLKFFRAVVYSGIVGYRKPRPEIYQEALRIMDAKPENSIFVSHDKEEVEGAERVGIRGVLVKSLEEVIGVL